MIKHIVLWKLKETAEGKTRQENFERMKRELEALRNTIPQIKRLEVGMNVIPSDAAYDAALYSEFENEQDLAAYLKHPEHVRAAEFVNKVRDSRVVVDYRV